MVSALDEKGRPTPLAATMMRAPMSRMDILTEKELNTLLSESKLVSKYNETIDRESAYEMLLEKIEKAELEETKRKAKEEKEKFEKAKTRKSYSSNNRQNPIVKVLTSPTVIRSVLGILGKMIK